MFEGERVGVILTIVPSKFSYVYATQLYFKTQQNTTKHNRSTPTPVETLHTILLGPYKYLLKTLIPQLTAVQNACQDEHIQLLRDQGESPWKYRQQSEITRLCLRLCSGHTYLMESSFKGTLHVLYVQISNPIINPQICTYSELPTVYHSLRL